MKLPDSQRDQLKVPLGILLPENQVEKNEIQRYLADDLYLITVGDRTTEKMIGFDLIPSLQIIDGQEKRKKRTISLPQQEDTTLLMVDNPAAEITPESISMIKKALTLKSPVRIYVNGEEDLLVLPVCLYAPENAVVMYGQPNEGLVIVKITAKIRNKVQTLLDLME